MDFCEEVVLARRSIEDELAASEAELLRLPRLVPHINFRGRVISDSYRRQPRFERQFSKGVAHFCFNRVAVIAVA